ncbi:hypothetical protein [Vibrio sonorensis]|uniref:hypothetical protein n=1 Tax=Vibrio sonorensis TaxID=1004316 RepID=UPI0008D9E787|nr:hypothetical protein [Vibrio sonorensis]
MPKSKRNAKTDTDFLNETGKSKQPTKHERRDAQLAGYYFNETSSSYLYKYSPNTDPSREADQLKTELTDLTSSTLKLNRLLSDPQLQALQTHKHARRHKATYSYCCNPQVATLIGTPMLEYVNSQMYLYDNKSDRHGQLRTLANLATMISFATRRFKGR